MQSWLQPALSHLFPSRRVVLTSTGLLPGASVRGPLVSYPDLSPLSASKVWPKCQAELETPVHVAGEEGV